MREDPMELLRELVLTVDPDLEGQGCHVCGSSVSTLQLEHRWYSAAERSAAREQAAQLVHVPAGRRWYGTFHAPWCLWLRALVAVDGDPAIDDATWLEHARDQVEGWQARAAGSSELDLVEASGFLDISTQSTRRMILRGELPAHRGSDGWLIVRHDLEQHVDKHRGDQGTGDR